MSEDTYYNKSDADNNNDNSTYYNNYYNNKQKSYFVKSFCFPNTLEVRSAFQEFDKLAVREGVSKSQLFLKALVEYLNRHSVPNPQITLDRALNTGLPAKPYNVCCVPGCNRKVAYRLMLQNYEGKTEIFQVCRVHKEWRHKEYRFITGFKEVEG